MKKQIKKFEIQLFDALATHEHYETAPQSFYKYLFRALTENKINLSGNGLEAGCGSGAFGRKLLQKYPRLRLTGVDISPKMVERANENKGKYKAIVGDLENQKLFKSDNFNLILCALVLHHFPSLTTVFASFKKWSKTGSYIIIIEPNSANLIGSFSKLSRKIFEVVLGKKYVVSHGYATPNEVDHPLETYLSLLRKNNYHNIIVKSGYIRPDIPVSLSLGGIKTVVTHLFRFIIPISRYTDNFVLITAQKK